MHEPNVTGNISAFDRIIFKGHLSASYPSGAFAARPLALQGAAKANHRWRPEQARAEDEAPSCPAGVPALPLQTVLDSTGGWDHRMCTRSYLPSEEVQIARRAVDGASAR